MGDEENRQWETHSGLCREMKDKVSIKGFDGDGKRARSWIPDGDWLWVWRSQ